MQEHVGLALTMIIALGVASQWIAWRLNIPSIVLLLLTVLTVGPLTGWIDIDALVPPRLLDPCVSMAVAIVLFEGGLQLKTRDIVGYHRVILLMVSLGALLCWGLCSLFAVLILGLPMGVSLLIGAILIVTGPTVITPLVRHIRPIHPIGTLLKWESIITDPIGAIVAVLVFQGLLQHTAGKALQEIGEGLFLTILIGGLIGWLAARLLVMMSKNRWLPEFLESLVALMLVLVAFSMAHHFQHESGLFSVTLMGVLIANQDEAELNIIEFKEILGTLLVSLLFIVLAAQVKFSQLLAINAKSVLYVICLLFVVRPLCVWCATLGAGLGWRERLFLSWMAPRGIVAAAIVSLFSTQLQKAGVPGAEEMVPLIFLVILVTVVVYGLTGPLLARAIGVGDANPQGLLLIGAQGWTRALAEVLQQEEVQVKLLDGNYEHVAKARMDGLDVEYTNVLSDQITEEVDLQGIGRLLALTSNEYVNSLVVLHFAPVFPKHELYQLLVRPDEKSTSSAKLPGHSLRGRPLFCEGWSASLISDAFEKGAIFKATSLTEAFPYEDFQAHYKGQAVPLFVLYPDGTLRPLTAEEKPNVEPPCTLVSLVLEEPEEQEEE